MIPIPRHRPAQLLAITALGFAALGCATLAPVVPVLEWDRSAEQEVIVYNCSGGLVPNEVWTNEIKAFRL